MATTHGQRVFILTIVVVFLLTSVAFTGFVIWDQVHQNNQNKQLEQAQAALNNQANSTSETNNESGDKLEGTQLAGFTPSTDKVTKLQIIDTKVGTGKEATKDSTITADYTGALVATGVIFQSSKDSGQPFTSPLSGLIKGWIDGIPGMKEGGIRRLIIPADQAYGASAQGGIPANSDLVFDIELHSVE